MKSPLDTPQFEMACFDALDTELQTILREWPGNLSARDVTNVMAKHGRDEAIRQIGRMFPGYQPPEFRQHRARGEPRRSRHRFRVR